MSKEFNKNMSKEVETFLKEIIEISKKHNLSLAHVDFHGQFIVEKFNQKNIEWLMDADDESK